MGVREPQIDLWGIRGLQQCCQQLIPAQCRATFPSLPLFPIPTPSPNQCMIYMCVRTQFANSSCQFFFTYFPFLLYDLHPRPAVATQPICLQKTRANLVVGKRATIAGWGKMSTSSLRQPEMSHLDVPLTSWDLCLRNYGSTGALESPNSIEGQWMCAGGEGKDVCQGFGGAPLFIQENGIFSQVRSLYIHMYMYTHIYRELTEVFALRSASCLSARITVAACVFPASTRAWSISRNGYMTIRPQNKSSAMRLSKIA